MKILILGSNGMLGHMVKKYLEQYHEIETINHRWPSEEFKLAIIDSKADFLINCVGAIPQRTKDFDINWELPIWLDLNSPCKIIHPGTDCEIDNDIYGISKNIASNYIKSLGKNTKILKTSIIGPEVNTNSSLLEWFLLQEEPVFGYTLAKWNGNTTLEWAKQCYKLINDWDNYPIECVLATSCISKYNLLNIIKKIFSKNIDIIPQEKGKNKCLACKTGDVKCPNIEDQLIELKSYYYDN